MNNQNNNQTNPSVDNQDVLNKYASSIKPDTDKIIPKVITPQDLDDTKTESSDISISEAQQDTPSIDSPFVNESQSSEKSPNSISPQSIEDTNPEVKEALKDFNAKPIDTPTLASLSDNLEASKSLTEESSFVAKNEPKLIPESEAKPEQENKEFMPEPEPQSEPEPEAELKSEPKIEPKSDTEYKPEPSPTIQTDINPPKPTIEDPEKIKQKIEEVLSYNSASSAVNSHSDKPKTSGFLKTLFTLSLLIFLAIIGALGYFYINPFSKNNSETKVTPTNTPTVPVQTGVVCELNGFVYNLGQSFPSADGCNTCTCVSADNITCTEKACADVTTTPATKSAVKLTTPTIIKSKSFSITQISPEGIEVKEHDNMVDSSPIDELVKISITFNKEADPQSINDNTFYVYKYEAEGIELKEVKVPGKIYYDNKSKTTTIVFTNPILGTSTSTKEIVTTVVAFIKNIKDIDGEVIKETKYEFFVK